LIEHFARRVNVAAIPLGVLPNLSINIFSPYTIAC
jgi:hypothetical protein